MFVSGEQMSVQARMRHRRVYRDTLAPLKGGKKEERGTLLLSDHIEVMRESVRGRNQERLMCTPFDSAAAATPARDQFGGEALMRTARRRGRLLPFQPHQTLVFAQLTRLWPGNQTSRPR